MLLVFGLMLCFFFILKGLEIYIAAVTRDPQQATNGRQVALGVLLLCFLAAAAFGIALNHYANHGTSIPNAVFGSSK